MKTRYCILSLLALLLGTLFGACHDDIDMPEQQGVLRISLDEISSSVQTRSIPSELGPVDKSKFAIRILNSDGVVVYNHAYVANEIKLPVGSYTVEASYGDNPVIGIDAPFYSGQQDVVIEQDKMAQANLVCKVANALVSVRFGRDAEEQSRFNSYYQEYQLRVKVGEHNAVISNAEPHASVYFRAGSQATLEFEGVLKSNGQKVSKVLDVAGTDFPTTFGAADHAIVTLSLADAGSTISVDINKVDLVEATLGATLPLEWLPAPLPVAKHQYDAQGDLVGTNLNFNNGYPGMDWKADVKDADGNLVRTVEGTGDITSPYGSSDAWPYLPAGSYKATYSVKMDGAFAQVTERSFEVESPALRVVFGGYTSFTRYKEGDVTAANACDAHTLYEPSVRLNVASSLLQHANYTCSYTTVLDGVTLTGTESMDGVVYPTQTGLSASLTAYVLMCTAQFGKQTIEGEGQYFITGLPAEYTSPTTASGWVASNASNVTWNAGNVVIGNANITNDGFAIPMGTQVNCAYKSVVQRGNLLQSTTFSLSVGDDEFYSVRSESTLFGGGQTTRDGNVTKTLTKDATRVRAANTNNNLKTTITSLVYTYAN